MDTMILFSFYKIDIPTQWEIVLSIDVIFDKGIRASSSQDSPLVVEENVEVVVLETNLETLHELDSEGDEVRLGLNMPLSSSLAHRRMILLN
jgi:hypothetical protein